VTRKQADKIRTKRLARIEDIRRMAVKRYFKHADAADALRKVVHDLDRWERQVQDCSPYSPIGLPANVDEILTALAAAAERER